VISTLAFAELRRFVKFGLHLDINGSLQIDFHAICLFFAVGTSLSQSCHGPVTVARGCIVCHIARWPPHDADALSLSAFRAPFCTVVLVSLETVGSRLCRSIDLINALSWFDH
jgi:hypothetical protein